MGKSKDYKGSEISELKQTIKNLKGSLRRRDKKIDSLLSEIHTLQRALDQSATYIDNQLRDIPVEDIVRYFSSKRRVKLKGASEAQTQNLKQLKRQWECHECGVGYMKLIVINRADGKKYMRMCSAAGCSNRTKLQSYHDDVEGVN